MVTIPGRLGKAKGNPLGPGEFEQEFYLGRAEAAEFLRHLADRIETSGPVEVSCNDWALSVDPREPLKLEVEYKSSKRELQLQLKLKEFP